MATKTDHLGELNKSVTSSLKEIVAKKGEIVLLTEGKKSLELSLSQKNIEIVNLKNEKGILRTELDKEKEEKLRVNKELDLNKVENLRLNNDIKDLFSAKNELEGIISEQRKEVELITGEKIRLTDQVADFEKQITILKNKYSETVEENTRLSDELKIYVEKAESLANIIKSNQLDTITLDKETAKIKTKKKKTTKKATK